MNPYGYGLKDPFYIKTEISPGWHSKKYLFFKSKLPRKISQQTFLVQGLP
jgi:hypothetical protein